ncbi:hypothetical protein [Bacillus subtilis]|uniref:hypothetical protein n=1 Tax=Bacillus subtilis TaxID=1423 RepID=UPI002029F8EC|nr:hypothetical protein [Bacillus subtilis]
MAKLTARFELEDKVSRKLLRIQKRFQTFEKQLKPFRKPVKINLDIDDKKLKNFSLSLRKISMISMRLDQGIFRDLKTLNNQLNMLPNHLVISLLFWALPTTYSRKESLSSAVRFQIKRGDHCDGRRS